MLGQCDKETSLLRTTRTKKQRINAKRTYSTLQKINQKSPDSDRRPPQQQEKNELIIIGNSKTGNGPTGTKSTLERKTKPIGPKTYSWGGWDHILPPSERE